MAKAGKILAERLSLPTPLTLPELQLARLQTVNCSLIHFADNPPGPITIHHRLVQEIKRQRSGWQLGRRLVTTDAPNGR